MNLSGGIPMHPQGRESLGAGFDPPADLLAILTARLKEALAQAETTDFSALDRALFEGLSSEQLNTFSRDQLHRQLVFALAETVLADDEAAASDWVVEAVRLFLARLAGVGGETAPLVS